MLLSRSPHMKWIAYGLTTLGKSVLRHGARIFVQVIIYRNLYENTATGGHQKCYTCYL